MMVSSYTIFFFRQMTSFHPLCAVRLHCVQHHILIIRASANGHLDYEPHRRKHRCPGISVPPLGIVPQVNTPKQHSCVKGSLFLIICCTSILTSVETGLNHILPSKLCSWVLFPCVSLSAFCTGFLYDGHSYNARSDHHAVLICFFLDGQEGWTFFLFIGQLLIKWNLQ